MYQLKTEIQISIISNWNESWNPPTIFIATPIYNFHLVKFVVHLTLPKKEKKMKGVKDYNNSSITHKDTHLVITVLCDRFWVVKSQCDSNK